MIIRHSYFRKRLLTHLIMGAIAIALVFAWQSLDMEFDWKIFAAALGMYIMLALLTEYQAFIRPMQALLRQVGLLLTGRPYAKMTVDRIDEVGVMTHFFNEVTHAFSTVKGQLQEHGRMTGELSFARNIQQAILPTHIPEIPGLNLAVRSEPAVELGGDSYDFLTRGEKTFFYLGDATGHGVPAALMMTMVSTLIDSISRTISDPKEIMVQLNSSLRTRIKAHMFMTMAFFAWDHEKSRLSYVGCGHERFVIFRAETGQCELKTCGGIALGMIPDNKNVLKEQEILLNKGDMFLLYSDGMIQAKNSDGAPYGLTRLQETFVNLAPAYGPDGVTHHLALDIAAFAKNALQEDDITLMAVSQKI